MGFADRASRTSSVRIGIITGLLHVGLGAAVLSTFTGGAIGTAIRNTLVANDWTYVPPPPKAPLPKPPATTHPLDATHSAPLPDPRPLAPLAPLDLQPPGPIGIAPIGDAFPGGGVSPFPESSPQPLPSASAAPLRAVPRGDPAAWITRNDYPAQALRAGWGGVTRFRLAIGSDGHVTDCTVTATSGHDLLDAVACERITRRASFKPARDETGAASPGVYVGALRWEITD
ncbi:energy transducer TonB [Novosphingobium sp.]|uniref:energy transducer TonB n=1 Tax=Novosphingobium sp. TaxID=1874826 RepID=UPI002FDD419E